MARITRKSSSNVTKKTVSHHEDTINDSTVISDISSIQIDDSDYLRGESENAVDTLLGCTCSSWDTSTNTTTLLEFMVVSKCRQCSCSTMIHFSDDSNYSLCNTQTLIEGGEEGAERDITVDGCNNTTFFKVENLRGDTSLAMPLAESTRIDSEEPLHDREVIEGIPRSDGSGTKNSTESRRLTSGLSKSITLNDTRDIDTTGIVLEDSRKPTNSRKEDSGIFSKDIDTAMEVLFKGIKDVYVATKMEEKEKD